jgi:hypothetical protein
MHKQLSIASHQCHCCSDAAVSLVSHCPTAALSRGKENLWTTNGKMEEFFIRKNPANNILYGSLETRLFFRFSQHLHTTPGKSQQFDRSFPFIFITTVFGLSVASQSQ